MTIQLRWYVRRGVVASAALAGLMACSRRADKAAVSDSTAMAPVPYAAPAPSLRASLDCTVASGDIEKLVCGDPKLSALDQKLGAVYQDALTKLPSPAPAWFTTAQRNWMTKRDDCGKSTNRPACLDSVYTLRIAEIQATNLLVATRGPVTYVCGNPDGAHDEISAMFAETNPRSVVLERGDKSVVAYAVRSASGAKYEAANVVFQEKRGEAQVTWFGARLKCREQAATS